MKCTYHEDNHCCCLCMHRFAHCVCNCVLYVKLFPFLCIQTSMSVKKTEMTVTLIPGAAPTLSAATSAAAELDSLD